MRPRVFVALPLAAAYLERIRDRCDVEVLAGPAPATPDDLVAAIAECDGSLGSNHLPFVPEALDRAPRLRVISNFGVGYDNVDLAHATKRGIVVTNTPGVLSDAVADLVLGLIVIMARRLREAEQRVREGRWGAGLQLGSDLAGKILAVIGFGRIGREVAARALACKMRVLACDARTSLDLPATVERAASLDDALRRADFVSLHVDLNPGTHHLIGADQLARMKPTAFLINAARGSVVDQRALSAALAEKRIAGAALDVLEQEPPDADDPLLQLDNVFMLPHIGSATVETRTAMLELAIDNLLACLHGERCACIVNPEALAIRRPA